MHHDRALFYFEFEYILSGLPLPTCVLQKVEASLCFTSELLARTLLPTNMRITELILPVTNDRNICN